MPLLRSIGQKLRIPALAYAFIIVLLYNPFVAIPGNIKFGIVVVVAALSWLFAKQAVPRSIPRVDLIVAIFLCLYAIMILRIHSVKSDPDFSFEKAILQPVVCMFLFCSSIVVARSVGIEKYLTALTIALMVVCTALLFNLPFLLNPRNHSPVGDFNFDSYQEISTVFGFVGIVAFMRYLKSQKFLSPYIFVFGICVMIIGLTPARGELVAFFIAIIAGSSPRLFALFAVFAVFSASTILSLMKYLHLPSFERFEIAVNDGWNEPRIVLFRQALDVLSDPVTALFGRGAYYFQKAHDFDAGMHPHNFILEAWISGGALLAISAVVIFVVPVVIAFLKSWTSPPVDRTIFAVSIFVLLLAAKSTTLLSNWLLAITLPIFLYLRQSVRSDTVIERRELS